MMNIEYDINSIKKVLSDYYELSKISVSIYDTEYNCLAASNEVDNSNAYASASGTSSTDNKSTSSFCRLIQKEGGKYQLCENYDNKIFEKVAQTKEPITYTCHAGIVESVHPILYDDTIIGYIVMGKFIDKEQEYSCPQNVMETATKYGINYDLLYKAYKKLPVLSSRQITAANNLLNLCVSFFLQKNLIYKHSDILAQRIKQYILDNLSSPLSIEDICKTFFISANKLYSMFKTNFNMSVKKFVLLERIKRAKKLLKTTDASVTEISREVGFYDYSYFIRIFKKLTGVSPLKYRNEYLNMSVSDI